ncbi:colicin E3/pyocin S6 family cytotoxin [Pseudomonas sp. LAM2023]|uniref:colicin E3/pyocin S6 family cytotoxin n=1 Tax=Pseudomonas sp. LAM2023 TaxID=2800477 RepID=UPI003FA389FE
MRVKPKTPVLGGGELRKRWKRANGCICEWDSQHGEVEMYNKRGKHMGAFDPETGEAISGKGADPTRTIEP